MANNIKYEVVEDFGVFGYKGNTKTFRLRLISWNGYEPKYDLRAWTMGTDGSEIPGKGFTLDQREDLETLRDLIEIVLENEGELEE